MGFRIIALALVLVGMQAQAEDQSVYRYQTQVMTASSEGQNECLQRAKQLKQILQTQVGLKTQAAQCTESQALEHEGENFRVHTLSVLYTADKEWRPQIDYLGYSMGTNMGVPGKSAGVFRTAAQCFSALPDQIELFREVNGIQELHGACIVIEDTVTSNQLKFAIQIESKGPTKNRLWVSQLGPWSRADENQFQNIAEEWLLSKGATISLMASSGPQIWYYSKNSMGPRVNRLAQLEHPNAMSLCEQQKSDLTYLDGLFCLEPRDYDPKGTSSVALYHMYSPGHNLKTPNIQSLLRDNLDYFTFESCLEDRANVREILEARNIEFFGLVCSLNSYIRRRPVEMLMVKRSPYKN